MLEGIVHISSVCNAATSDVGCGLCISRKACTFVQARGKCTAVDLFSLEDGASVLATVGICSLWHMTARVEAT